MMQNFLQKQNQRGGRDDAAAKAGFRGLCTELDPCVMCPGVTAQPLSSSKVCKAAGTGSGPGNVTETPSSGLSPTPSATFPHICGGIKLF